MSATCEEDRLSGIVRDQYCGRAEFVLQLQKFSAEPDAATRQPLRMVHRPAQLAPRSAKLAFDDGRADV
jgi:hypothetical protein